MQKHTKIYLESFGYDLADSNQFIPSEISGTKAVDIHHIISRGKGGEDRIENLIAVSRFEHDKYGDKFIWMSKLLKIHESFLRWKGVEYDKGWFKKHLKKYGNE